MSGTQVFSHAHQRYSDEQGSSAVGKGVLSATIGTRSEREIDSAPDVVHGMISSMSEQQVLRRSGHERALQHALSDSVQARGSSKGTRGKASCRVFNSTAAVWVHSVVLEPSDPAGSPTVRIMEPNTFPAQNNSSSSEHTMRLTAGAQRAIEELFDRYDIEGQGFLPSSGIASIQEIWTRPDAEPPPPRRSTSSSLLRPHRGPGPSEVRRGSTSSLAGFGCETDKRDMRALTRESFVEFCRRAAARDAIFIRHMFVRSGYDYRLELPPGTAKAVASAAVSARPRVARIRSAAQGERTPGKDTTQRKRDPKVVIGMARTAPVKENVMQSNRRGLPQGGANRMGGAETANSGAARSRSSNGKHVGQTRHVASTQDERGYFEHGNDDARGLVTGGIVDASELWDWTDDRRDHEERHERGGLLSRGGGAHVSRVAPGAITGGFANRSCAKYPSSTTEALAGGILTVNDEDILTAPASPQDLGATHVCADAAPCSPSSTAVAHDRDAVFEGETLPLSDHGGSKAGGIMGDPDAAQEDGGLTARAKLDATCAGPSEERSVTRGVSPCAWCGAVFDAKDRVAVHTAEYCDEGSVVGLDSVVALGAR